MGGKSSAPPAPDYTPIAMADARQAQNEYDLGQQQLKWGQDQFNTVWPYAQQYLQSQTAATQQEQQNAVNMQNFYNQTYKPIETSFASTALNYNSPARANQNAAAAEADVSNTFNANRNAATASLESFGIDPSQTRFGALDLGSRISQAAAGAAAGTQSRLNTEATGLALQGEAINTGRGYPGSVAQAYSTATNAGSSGLSAANSTINTGSTITGTPTSYLGLGNTSLNNEAGALNTGYQNRLQQSMVNNQVAASRLGGIGSLVGGAIGLGLNFLP
jgi:hypothetical protein